MQFLIQFLLLFVLFGILSLPKQREFHISRTTNAPSMGRLYACRRRVDSIKFLLFWCLDYVQKLNNMFVVGFVYLN